VEKRGVVLYEPCLFREYILRRGFLTFSVFSSTVKPINHLISEIHSRPSVGGKATQTE